MDWRYFSKKKSYNEESDEEYFLKVDVQYPEKLYKLNNDLPFTNLHDKTVYVMG